MKLTLRAVVMFFFFLSPAIAAEKDKEKEGERLSAMLDEAYQNRATAISKANLDYRAAISKTFQFADRVEVFLLDFSMGKDEGYEPKDDEETFPIRPYEKQTKILKSLKVPAKLVPSWCAAVAKVVNSEKPGEMALCHLPIHGVRIYAKDELLFETSICWKCNNCYFNYVSDSQWLVLNEDSDDLKKLLDDFAPIPESELKRLPGYKPKSNDEKK